MFCCQAVLTMVPEAWQNDKTMTKEKRDFYNWCAFSMEPWDGPALLTFTDGRYIGAILDRNGLRPSRFYVTKDNFMYMSSEVGVTDRKAEEIVQKVGHFLYKRQDIFCTKGSTFSEFFKYYIF